MRHINRTLDVGIESTLPARVQSRVDGLVVPLEELADEDGVVGVDVDVVYIDEGLSLLNLLRNRFQHLLLFPAALLLGIV